MLGTVSCMTKKCCADLHWLFDWYQWRFENELKVSKSSIQHLSFLGWKQFYTSYYLWAEESIVGANFLKYFVRRHSSKGKSGKENSTFELFLDIRCDSISRLHWGCEWEWVWFRYFSSVTIVRCSRVFLNCCILKVDWELSFLN